MRPATVPEIVELSADALTAKIPALARLLHDCVQAGASINFVLPFTEADAEAFWRERVLSAARSGERIVLAACDGGDIVGTVQLCLAQQPNQPHRAEVTKLMVHPDRRRGGLGRALMAELEQRARDLGRGLITLDTRTGDAAERLYTTLGYRTVGTITGYCLDPLGSDRLDSTTVMCKTL